MRYEIIDHTADIGIKAYGRSIEEAFENAAYGMFDIISDTSKVEPVGEYLIRLESDSLEELLVDFLSELLYIFEVQHLIFGKFEVKLDGTKLEARIFGEKFNPEKHPKGIEIKAVTYHILEVNASEGYVKVLFDI